jgi:hypothetical protein
MSGDTPFSSDSQNTQTQPTAPVSKEPSLWKRILGGALLGLSGADYQHPENSFGGGMRAVQEFEDRRLRRAAFVKGQEREERRLTIEERRAALEQERVGFERERLGLERRSVEEQSALTMLNKLRLEKEIAQMPEEQRRKWTATMAEYIRSLSSAGARIRFVTSDNHASMTAVAQEFGTPQSKTVEGAPDAFRRTKPEVIRENEALQRLMPVHDRANHRIIWFERPDDLKIYPKDSPDIVLPSGRRIQVAGQPIALTDARLHLEGVIEAARINATARENAAGAAKAKLEKPLTMKEALTQARQELAPLVEADAYLPQSRRLYPDQAAVSKAVNKRAQELLDLDVQLRRTGITQTSNIISAVSGLKELRRRGASDAELKQTIATAAMQGQLTGPEIVQLYDLLGLTPTMTKPESAPTAAPAPLPGEGGQPITTYKGFALPAPKPAPQSEPTPAPVTLTPAH